MGRGNHSIRNIRRVIIGATIGAASLMIGAAGTASGGGYPPTTAGAPTTTAQAGITIAPTTTRAAANTGGGTNLPRTGGDTAPFLLGGVGVLGVGFGALAISRRRMSPSA
jgi:LPXTG-motif cell wall-anchored protein